MRTDSRRGKVVSVPSKYRNEEVASLKTMRCETGSQLGFFKRGVTRSRRFFTEGQSGNMYGVRVRVRLIFILSF